MVKSVEGIYRNGKVELVEPLAEAEGSRVIVTWVNPAEPVDLRERGIEEPQAADLRRIRRAASSMASGPSVIAAITPQPSPWPRITITHTAADITP